MKIALIVGVVVLIIVVFGVLPVVVAKAMAYGVE
jgi:hypothetical protein